MIGASDILEYIRTAPKAVVDVVMELANAEHGKRSADVTTAETPAKKPRKPRGPNKPKPPVEQPTT